MGKLAPVWGQDPALGSAGQETPHSQAPAAAPPNTHQPRPAHLRESQLTTSRLPSRSDEELSPSWKAELSSDNQGPALPSLPGHLLGPSI